MSISTDLSYFMRIPSEIRLMVYDILLDDCCSKTFMIRSETVEAYRRRGQHRRTGYRVIGGGLLRQCQMTTYHLFSDATLHTNILSVNRKIHEEASQVLYGRHAFDFGSDIEAMVPFLSDLTVQTRHLIQEISLTKQGSVYAREFDRCEWSNVCAFIAEELDLHKLVLKVIGGQPLADGRMSSNIQLQTLEHSRVWTLRVSNGSENCAESGPYTTWRLSRN